MTGSLEAAVKAMAHMPGRTVHGPSADPMTDPTQGTCRSLKTSVLTEAESDGDEDDDERRTAATRLERLPRWKPRWGAT